jgi:hypothetical protein
VTRQKWEFKDKGEIHISVSQSGKLVGPPLLEGGQVQWFTRPHPGNQKLTYRTNAGHIELGQLGSSVWEPILPESAAVGDSWEWAPPNSNVKRKYSIVKFDQYKGKPAVVIRDSIPGTAPLPKDCEVVTSHTFVQGIGEVARTRVVEKKGERPLLLGEVKLVEE